MQKAIRSIGERTGVRLWLVPAEGRARQGSLGNSTERWYQKGPGYMRPSPVEAQATSLALQPPWGSYATWFKATIGLEARKDCR